jgi:hypothetical protein
MCCMTGIDDLCFLSQDTFLTMKPPGKFEVYTFVDPAVCSNTPITRGCYGLPVLSDGLTYWCISMSCNPVAGYTPGGVVTKGSGVAAVTTPLHQPRSDERINGQHFILTSHAHTHSHTPQHATYTFLTPNTRTSCVALCSLSTSTFS